MIEHFWHLFYFTQTFAAHNFYIALALHEIKKILEPDDAYNEIVDRNENKTGPLFNRSTEQLRNHNDSNSIYIHPLR